MLGWVYFAAVMMFSTPPAQEYFYRSVDNATATILNIQPAAMATAKEKGYLGVPKDIAWAPMPKEIERKIIMIEAPKVTQETKVVADNSGALAAKKKKQPESIQIDKSGHIEDLGLLNGGENTQSAVTDEILTYFEKRRSKEGGNEVSGAFIVPNQESAQPLRTNSRATFEIK